MSLRAELLAQGCAEEVSKTPNKAKRVTYFSDPKGEAVAKVCTMCNELKEREGFCKDKGKLCGLKSWCRDCEKKYREENREKMRRYYEENRERLLEKRRIYREENREKIRKYREENREKMLDYHCKYREENREETREKSKLRKHRRRAREKSLPDNFTIEQQNEVLDHFNNACALTGDSTDRSWDHAIPINSGHGGTTYGNMYPLRLDLNISKHDRNIFEWFEANRQRFDLSQERFDSLIAWLASANAMSVDEYRDYVNYCHENPRTIDELKEEAQ